MKFYEKHPLFPSRCSPACLFLLILLFNCRQEEVSLNPNKASLTYNGQSIDFNDIKIESGELDLDLGDGFRAFGTANLEATTGYNYYIILDYQLDSAKNYRFHKINFGVKKKTGPMSYYQSVYAASLTPGYNATNF